MLKRKRHLDSIYRNRWEEFYLANGTVEDSRLKNWREVAWDQVIQITVHMVGYTYTVNCKDPRFKAFMNFRWGGFDHGKPIDVWAIGWTDGKNCFLKDIDIYTGRFIKDYVEPLSKFRGHLHPDIRGKILG